MANAQTVYVLALYQIPFVLMRYMTVTYEDAGGAMDTSEAETDGKEYPCLIRVTNGKDINLSTHVSIHVYFLLSCYTPTSVADHESGGAK